jgi:transposase
MKEIINPSDKVFVGIDVHANSYSFAEVISGKVVKKNTIPAEPEILITTLKRKYPEQEIRTVYEAGFSGFALHRKLEKNGIKNIIVNASSIESNHKNKVKTDKIDSTKLAMHLYENRLTGIPIPSEELEDLRMITRTRKQLVDSRRRLLQQVRMRLHYFGLIPPNYKKVLTLQGVDLICKDNLKIKIALLPLISVWKSCNTEIIELMKTIRRTNSPIIQILKSIPGIGQLAAVTIYNELGDMSHFSNEKKLSSYIGLTPSEYSSGESVNRGRITKQGKPELRRILVLAAHIARLKCPALKEKYQRIVVKSCSGTATIAIARRLIVIASSLVKSGKFYKPIFIGEIVD